MIVQDQSKVVEFLSNADAFGRDTHSVDVIETHVSMVFVGANRVYKLKRAVRFPYLDFSTAEARWAACEAEVRVNVRTAPDLYRGVRAITAAPDGSLRFDGDGEAEDWVVEMVRFDQDTLFDAMARRGGLDRHLVGDLAEAVARFHDEAEEMPDAGGFRALLDIYRENMSCFAEVADVFDPDKLRALERETTELLEVRGRLMDMRKDHGRVRHCHGDLHLRNVFLMNGEPTLFDGVEFNEDLTNIDVLYDLAFLIMDLQHWGLGFLAGVLLNRYLDLTGDTEGLACMPLFLSLRAAIRAHVEAAAAASVSHPEEADALADDARRYLDNALAFLVPAEPRLIAIGGVSGSGKSRLAREIAPYLAPAPGARVVRSDVTRKNLAGVRHLTRLGPEGYTQDMTERTFHAMFEEVRAALRAGYSVIADAVFARPQQRKAIAMVATEMDVPFDGLWLESPRDVMEHRVRHRRRNVSDATVEVIRMQLDYDVGRVEWTKVDSSGAREETIKRGLRALGL